jgi:hypothetical protein
MKNVFLLKKTNFLNNNVLFLSNLDETYTFENTRYQLGFEIDNIESGVIKYNKFEFNFRTLNQDFQIGDLIEISKIIQGQKIIVFVGEIFSISKYDNSKLNVSCVSLIKKLLQKRGKFFSSNCRATLGDALCKKNISSVTFSGIVTEIGSSSIFFGNHYNPKPNYFSSGYIEFKTGKLSNQKIYIIKNENNLIQTINNSIPPQIGDEYIIIAGCDKNFSTCKEKFNNVENFRGEPFLNKNNL